MVMLKGKESKAAVNTNRTVIEGKRMIYETGKKKLKYLIGYLLRKTVEGMKRWSRIPDQ